MNCALNTVPGAVACALEDRGRADPSYSRSAERRRPGSPGYFSFNLCFAASCTFVSEQSAARTFSLPPFCSLAAVVSVAQFLERPAHAMRMCSPDACDLARTVEMEAPRRSFVSRFRGAKQNRAAPLRCTRPPWRGSLARPTLISCDSALPVAKVAQIFAASCSGGRLLKATSAPAEPRASLARCRASPDLECGRCTHGSQGPRAVSVRSRALRRWAPFAYGKQVRNGECSAVTVGTTGRMCFDRCKFLVRRTLRSPP